MPISRATWGRPDGGLEGQAGRQTLAIPYASLYFLQFNAKASPALGNPAFWEAARWLFDYKGIADDLLKGQFQSHQAFLPDGYLGRSGSAVPLQSAKAKEILAKAGLSNVSFRLDVNNQPPYLDIAQALQASFAQGGVKVELVPGISSQVSTKVKALNYDATLTSWGRIISTLTPMPQPSPTTRKTAARRWPGAPTGRSRR